MLRRTTHCEALLHFTAKLCYAVRRNALHMTTVTIDDPDEVTKRVVNDSGNFYIGREYAGKTVEVVVRVVDDG